jgi:hypothetical protein
VEILQRVIGEKLFTLKRVEEELPVFQFLHEQEFTKCMKIGLLSLMTQDMSIFLTDIIEQT